MKNNITYSLQGIRIFAAFIVVLYHINFVFHEKLGIDTYHSYFNFGGTGVHLFFVLSGYVIYLVHNKDIGKGFNIGKLFAWKRFIRIYPTYWVITTFVIFAMFFLPGQVKAYKFNAAYIFQSYSLFELGLMKHGLPIVTVAWSLFHEMKFYCLFFLLIIIKNKKARATLVITLLLFTFLNMIDENLLGVNVFNDFYFSPLNLLFMLGILAAWISTNYNQYLNSKFFIVLSVSFYAVISFICDWQLWDVNNYTIILFGVAAFMVITSFTGYEISAINKTGKSPFKLSKFGLLLADATYCFYLLHIPVYTIVIILNKHLKLPNGLLMVTMITTAMVISLIYYKLIEYPLIDLLRRRTFKNKKSPVLAKSNL